MIKRNNFVTLSFCLVIFTLTGLAQDKPKDVPKTPEKPATVAAQKATISAPKIVALKADATPLEMANAAIEAHGGDKFRKMKTLVMRGSVDVNANNFSLAGTFANTIAGEKYRTQIQSPFFSFVQASDGNETFSTINGGITVPPPTRIGLPVLQRVGDPGFTIEALADKKKRGFKITTPDNYTVNFYLDEKTSQVKGFEATFDAGSRTVTTAVEHDKFKLTEGVLLPERFSQRFDVQGITAYSDFKVKEVLVNSEIAEDVFKSAS